MMPLPRIVFSLTRKSISHDKHCIFRQLSSLNTSENVPAVKEKKKKIVRKNVVGSVEPQNIHTAIVKMREAAWAKFDETVEVAVNLGVDPRKPNQSVKVIAPVTLVIVFQLMFFFCSLSAD
jgi:hypothetical protein